MALGFGCPDPPKAELDLTCRGKIACGVIEPAPIPGLTSMKRAVGYAEGTLAHPAPGSFQEKAAPVAVQK